MATSKQRTTSDQRDDRSMGVSAADPERVTKWALDHIGVTDGDREHLIADEQCQQYAVLFRHVTTVREAASQSSDERWQLTNSMFSAELAFRRYVSNEINQAAD